MVDALDNIPAKKRLLDLYLEKPVRNMADFFQRLEGVSYETYRGWLKDKAFDTAMMVAKALKFNGSLDTMPTYEYGLYQEQLSPEYRHVIDTAIDVKFTPYIKAIPREILPIDPEQITFVERARAHRAEVKPRALFKKSLIKRNR